MKKNIKVQPKIIKSPVMPGKKILGSIFYHRGNGIGV